MGVALMRVPEADALMKYAVPVPTVLPGTVYVGPMSVGPVPVIPDAVPVAPPGGAAAAAVTTPHVAVFALAETSTDPAAPGAVAAETPTVPPETVRAFAIVAVPAAVDVVAVPAYCTVPATLADPTVPAVVDQDASVPPALTCVTVRTEPAAPGAACPATFTVPVASVRALAIVAVPLTVAVPALPAIVAVPALVAKPEVVAVPAFVAKPATPAEPTVPVVVLHTAVLVFEDVSTEPAAPGAVAPATFTVPVASSSAIVTVEVPAFPPPPELTGD